MSEPVQHGQPVTIEAAEPAERDEQAQPAGAENAAGSQAFSVDQGGVREEAPAQAQQAAPPQQAKAAEPAEGARNTDFVPGEQAPLGESGQPLPAPGLAQSERQTVTATSNESPGVPDDVQHALARAHAGIGMLVEMGNRLLADIEGYVPQSVVTDARNSAAQVLRDVL
jgi:hypothetical protein